MSCVSHVRLHRLMAFQHRTRLSSSSFDIIYLSYFIFLKTESCWNFCLGNFYSFSFCLCNCTRQWFSELVSNLEPWRNIQLACLLAFIAQLTSRSRQPGSPHSKVDRILPYVTLFWVTLSTRSAHESIYFYPSLNEEKSNRLGFLSFQIAKYYSMGIIGRCRF